MQAGNRIGERYVLRRLIGEGAMGSVWEAHDERLGVDIAIKFLKLEDAAFRERFRAEASVLARIHHAAVANSLDFDADHNPPYLTMRLVDGSPLAGLPLPLPAAAVRRLLRDIAEGLTAAHAAGVVHRDLTPSNILVDTQGTAVIIDFGLVTQSASNGPTASPLGTPEYWAPEQALGQSLTGKADVYAAGTIAFMLLTGGLPFPLAAGGDRITTSLKRTQSTAPPVESLLTAPTDEALCGLINDLLLRDPELRPTAQAVATRIEQMPPMAVAAAPVHPHTAVPASAPTMPTAGAAAGQKRARGGRRMPVLATVGVGLLAAIVLAVAAITLTQGESTPPTPTTAPIAEPSPTTAASATTAADPPEPAAAVGIHGRFGSFDTIQQCRGLGKAVECYSAKSGLLIRLSAANGIEFSGAVEARPWSGPTRALALGVATPTDPASPIFCLSSRRGVTCGFNPDIPYLGAGTNQSDTGTLTGCGGSLKDEYFAIGDDYVRYCHQGTEQTVRG